MMPKDCIHSHSSEGHAYASNYWDTYKENLLMAWNKMNECGGMLTWGTSLNDNNPEVDQWLAIVPLEGKRDP